MFERREEVKKSGRRPGLIAKATSSLVIALAACSGSDNDSSATAAKQSISRGEHVNAEAAILALHHDMDTSHTKWQSRQIVSAGNQTLRIYREAGPVTAEGEVQALLNAVRNSQLLGQVKPITSQVAKNGTMSDFTINIPNNVSHNFLVFNSVESVSRAHRAGFRGPITSIKPDQQGGMEESVTLLAPFKNAAYSLNSDLEHRTYQRQRAVCGNIIDIVFGEETKKQLFSTLADDPDVRTNSLLEAEMEIKGDVCENLAIAATVKSGEEHVQDLGGGYAYYSMIANAIQEEAAYYGQQKPHLKLPQQLFEQLVS